MYGGNLTAMARSARRTVIWWVVFLAVTNSIGAIGAAIVWFFNKDFGLWCVVLCVLMLVRKPDYSYVRTRLTMQHRKCRSCDLHVAVYTIAVHYFYGR